MKILVTGSAGFIGFHLCNRLLKEGYEVIGIDNINDYYDPELKNARLKKIEANSNYQHNTVNIANRSAIKKIFEDVKPTIVINLAAQAGVRYSIENPAAYIDSNLVGFANVLEGCRHQNVKHLIYASSSSVYGANQSMPFSVIDSADHPLSLYAASKRSNELLAHTYSHLYELPTTGLRFFTVYGPWGRPDMALFKFTKAIHSKEPIDVYNYGKHKRDFTYIDDIIDGIMKVFENPCEKDTSWDGLKPNSSTSFAPWKIYNIGSSSPVELMDYIKAIEKALGEKAILNLLPLQPGDVPDTYADVKNLMTDFGYSPKMNVEEGVKRFIEWYLEFYKG